MPYTIPLAWPLRVVTKRIADRSRTAAIPSPRNPIRNIHLSLHVFKRLGAPNLFSYWRALVRVIGSLDTFDLFDSVGPERPKKLLDYVLLSIPSVLVSDLPLEKSAIA